MEVLPKDIIRTWILPHLTQSRNGRPSRVDPVELIETLLYKLKTGCQWRYLPVKQFFTGASLTWQGVYARFNAWRKDGPWKTLWLNVLRRNKRCLDCSSVQLDGSHTPAKNGGAAAPPIGKPTTTLSLTPNSTVDASWSNTPTPGSTASKPCSCAMKLALAIGWPFIDSHSLSSFYEKLRLKRLSTQLR